MIYRLFLPVDCDSVAMRRFCLNFPVAEKFQISTFKLDNSYAFHFSEPDDEYVQKDTRC